MQGWSVGLPTRTQVLSLLVLLALFPGCGRGGSDEGTPTSSATRSAVTGSSSSDKRSPTGGPVSPSSGTTTSTADNKSTGPANRDAPGY